MSSRIQQYGIQIRKTFGILQIVWGEGKLRVSLRKNPTDRYPIWGHNVPDDENHQFCLVVDTALVGYLTMDADSYGEVEVYRDIDTHLLLKEHHIQLGLKVVDMGNIKLERWQHKQ
jgi:hypothetical protein